MEVTNGQPKMLEGNLSFSRSQVKTDSTAWDPGRDPASVTEWVIADQLPFSMKLEKSQ
jgi:hypothetical protein